MIKNIQYSNIMGLDIANISMDETLEVIHSLIQSGEMRNTIYTPNSDFLVNASRSPAFYKILSRATLLLADGMPLVWASKIFGSPLKEKISGSTLFLKTCEYARDHSLKIYLLGAAPGVANLAEKKLKSQYPGLDICGTWSPSFEFEKSEQEITGILSDLRQKKPDILLVGLGSPKQERWTDSNLKKLNIPIIMCLGASIDFAAGLKRLPPSVFKRLGLGWLWRLISEPGRLWKRYLVKDMKVWYLFLIQKTNCNQYKYLINQLHKK